MVVAVKIYESFTLTLVILFYLCFRTRNFIRVPLSFSPSCHTAQRYFEAGLVDPCYDEEGTAAERLWEGCGGHAKAGVAGGGEGEGQVKGVRLLWRM